MSYYAILPAGHCAYPPSYDIDHTLAALDRSFHQQQAAFADYRTKMLIDLRLDDDISYVESGVHYN